MEGVSMYLTTDQMQSLAACLSAHFEEVALLVDAYSTLAAKMSKYKNPVREVGVTEVYGIDDPVAYQGGDFAFLREHEMTPKVYIDQLQGMEKRVFEKLYAGNFSKKLYRLFEYQKA